MKRKVLIALVISLVAFLPLGTIVLAQGAVPAPYTGLKNPFPWNDPGVQTAGQKVYQQNCLGCHGVTGNGIAGADFRSKNYPGQLESAPDYYFWILSEGNMDAGMPSFKASLSEEQRWQVLTYVWSLANAPVTPASGGPPPTGTVQLNSVTTGTMGQPLAISAIVLDKTNKPITGFPVSFFVKENFFAAGLMAIGDNITDEQGVASVEYIPRQAGKTDIVAIYGDTQATTTTFVTEADIQFYQAEAGIQFPAVGPKVFIGPASATEPSIGHAPTAALRLPGGLFSGLWLIVLALVLIWGTYFRVMYQVLRIAPGRTTNRTSNLVPKVALIFIVLLCVLDILMIITGPYSHFHLIPK